MTFHFLILAITTNEIFNRYERLLHNMCTIIPKGMIVASQNKLPPLITEHALPNKGINVSETSTRKVTILNNDCWWLTGGAFCTEYMQNKRIIENAALSLSRSTFRSSKHSALNQISHDPNSSAAFSLVSLSGYP